MLSCQSNLILNLGSIRKANYANSNNLLSLSGHSFLTCNVGILVSILKGCSEVIEIYEHRKHLLLTEATCEFPVQWWPAAEA